MLTSCLALLIVLSVAQSQPGPGPSCLCFEVVGNEGEFYNPITITHAGDGSGRLFIGEQRGYIWMYEDGIRQETPFLNITDTQIHPVDGYGIMAFVFHPEFSINGQIYLYWFIMEDDVVYMKISEFSMSSEDDIIDSSSERELYRIPFPNVFFPHTGGMLMFGDDGYLYFGIGDGLCCMDPFENGQNKSTPYAAAHRIDVDSRSGELPYGIPPDNPFLDDPEALPTLYAYGLRQPWKGNMDTGDRLTGEGRGRLFVGDVGDEDFEEINMLQSGGNYGWPIYEGPLCHEEENCDSLFDYIPPIDYYNRSMGICVIYGGVYRGCLNPDLDGWMMMVDYASKFFFGAAETTEGSWPLQRLDVCSECPPGLTNDRGVYIISMGADEAGDFYFGSVTSIEPDDAGGTVYRIVDPNSPGSPCSSKRNA